MKTAPGIRIQHVDQMVLDTYVDLIHYLEAQFHSLGAVRRPKVSPCTDAHNLF